MAAGNNAAARKSLVRAAALDPYLARPVIDLAACAMREDQPREAQRILRDFLRRDPGNAEALLALSQIALHENRRSDAREYLREVLRKDPGNAQAATALQALDEAGR